MQNHDLQPTSGNVPPPPEPPQYAQKPQAQTPSQQPPQEPPNYTAQDFMCAPTDDDYPF